MPEVSEHQIRVNLSQLMKEAASTCQTPAVSIGFSTALTSLEAIAREACRIKNTIILEQLELLNLVERK